MAGLVIRLLGVFQTELDGKPVTRFETEKARALLAYLAAEKERSHQRESLAEMFWPERPEGAARANLRHTLGILRTAIKDRTSSEASVTNQPFLLVTRETIQLNPNAEVWVDTSAFLQLTQDTTSNLKPSVSRLEEAAALYRGAFLENISVEDSAIFSEWILLKREQFQNYVMDALYRLARFYELLGMYDRALEFSWRQVDLASWDERAHQQVMRLLALSGQRGTALTYFETCRNILAEELGVEPGMETIQLYERIRDGNLAIPTVIPTLVQQPALRVPGFLDEDAGSVEPPIFVARKPALAQLGVLMQDMLEGHGRVVFVTGDAGQGKTALLKEFARRAMEAHPKLLVAQGNCNAYSGIGDPYLPFRDVMAMLTGDVEPSWAAGAITRDHACRLWGAQSLAVQAVVTGGDSLINTILTGEALNLRAAIAVPDCVDWLERLGEIIRYKQTHVVELEQSHLFEQYANVLRVLAEQHPLVLILDDMQWADNSSTSLLFHLGRRLADCRVLILCAYRPEEVSLGRGGERHPLVKVLTEFKRIFGHVWVDLNQMDPAEARKFVDELLDTEPNRLDEGFRAALFHRTAGHPLFTLEMLREGQERGDLIKDSVGNWIEAPTLNWESFPVRVEAVIEERINRLDPQLKEIVTVASVEGETFTAQVVSEVLKMSERAVLERLSQELGGRHRLVREEQETQATSGRLSRFKFSHVLYRDFIYNHLSQGERRILHGEVAVVLERFYEGRLDELAAQLAYHFYHADEYNRAFQYFTLAAGRAARLYANEEAINYFTRAIEMPPIVSADTVELAHLYRGRGLAYEAMGEFERSRADYETALRVAGAAGDCRTECRALLDLGKLWTSRDYHQSRDYFEQALNLARQINDPVMLANSLNWLGNWHINAENPLRAVEHHLEALEIFEGTGDRRDLANTLDLLGIASHLGGNCLSSLAYYDRAIALFRELDDRPGLASSLTGRGNLGGAGYTSLSVVPALKPSDALHDFEEAVRIAGEIGSPANEIWTLWSLGLLYLVAGNFGRALEYTQNSLRIASEIGHGEGVVGARTVLGHLYVAMLAPEEALRQLEESLDLARQLHSQHWIHQITGMLATVHYLLGDFVQAQTCLETVISSHTPMDTVNKRFCWARRAELALSQSDPTLALEITDRLIASAPGMPSGGVITFLWKLKGEALAALGCEDEAITFLRTAITNAQENEEQFLLWRVHASLGRLYRAINCPTDAQTEYAAASKLIKEMAATIPDKALKENYLRGAYRALTNPP